MLEGEFSFCSAGVMNVRGGALFAPRLHVRLLTASWRWNSKQPVAGGKAAQAKCPRFVASASRMQTPRGGIGAPAAIGREGSSWDTKSSARGRRWGCRKERERGSEWG